MKQVLKWSDSRHMPHHGRHRPYQRLGMDAWARCLNSWHPLKWQVCVSHMASQHERGQASSLGVILNFMLSDAYAFSAQNAAAF